MANKKPVFICATGELLARWKLAFPNAVAVAPQLLTTASPSDVFWLRLEPTLPASAQIKALQTVTGAATLIVLSDTPNDDEAMAAFSLSVRGYVNSHAAAKTLKQVAKVVDQGGLWIGESLMQRLLTGMQSLPKPATPALAAGHNLTDRELEVAKAIATGASNKEVARQLNITERTVKAHVSGLFAKLAVSDRLQLALKMREMVY